MAGLLSGGAVKRRSKTGSHPFCQFGLLRTRVQTLLDCWRQARIASVHRALDLDRAGSTPLTSCPRGRGGDGLSRFILRRDPYMTQLTDTQLVLLSAAANYKDGILPINNRLKGGAAKVVAQKLLALGLAEEQAAPPSSRGWRVTAEGHQLVLVITSGGLAAIGVEASDGFNSVPDSTPACTPTAALASSASSHVDHPSPPIDASTSNKDPCPLKKFRSGTKKAEVIGLLGRADGASIGDICALTGWLAHTTRAALTGLRKDGMVIELVRREGCVAHYRIAGKNEVAPL